MQFYFILLVHSRQAMISIWIELITRMLETMLEWLVDSQIQIMLSRNLKETV